MNQKIRRGFAFLAYFSIALLFVLYIFYSGKRSYTEQVKRTIHNTKWELGSLKNLSDNFEGILQKGIYKKFDYINLSGLVAKMQGLNTLNRLQRLQNGQLASFNPSPANMWRSIEKLTKLKEFLDARCIPFQVIVVPSKTSVYDASFLPGYETGDLKTFYSKLIGTLRAKGIETIDMNSVFKTNGLTSKEIFFRTDHHWTPEASLLTARMSLPELAKKAKFKYRADLIDESKYRISKLRRFFLGGWGRRVGRYYELPDDFTIYTPLPGTEIQYAGQIRKTTLWTYRNTLLDSKMIDHKDYYRRPPILAYPYSAYVGDQLPIQIGFNPKAPNDKKVLLLGDSYRRPWHYFANTQFKEIHSLELRDYTDGTTAQYIEQLRPDAVVFLAYADSMFANGKLFDFGIEALEKAIAENQTTTTEAQIKEVVAHAPQEQPNGFSLVSGLTVKPGNTYTLQVKSTQLLGTPGKVVQMALWDLTTNQMVATRYFKANENNPQTWVFTVPNEPNDAFGVYLYAGNKGQTQNATAKVEGITLWKGVREEANLCVK